MPFRVARLCAVPDDVRAELLVHASVSVVLLPHVREGASGLPLAHAEVSTVTELCAASGFAV